MAKAKKTSKKLKISPANLERNIMLVLLVALLVSAGVLIFRNTNLKSEISESPTVIEPTGE